MQESKLKNYQLTVTEEDIQSELNGLLERQAEIVVKDGAVENGDTAVIDYEGI